MHGFQHSRGRIFFDAVCALAVSASCAGAWVQTGASALLPAAGAALLLGLVRLFDMRTRAEEPQRIDFPAEPADDMPPAMEPVADLPVPVEMTVRAASDDPPAKPARKSSARRASAPKKPKLVEVEIADPVETEAPAYHEHPPLTPLFEPVPVVREMRTFGRKAG